MRVVVKNTQVYVLTLDVDSVDEVIDMIDEGDINLETEIIIDAELEVKELDDEMVL
jgi:hypothetical protein